MSLFMVLLSLLQRSHVDAPIADDEGVGSDTATA